MVNTAYRQRQLELIKQIKEETAEWDLETDYGGMSPTKIKLVRETKVDMGEIAGIEGVMEIRRIIKEAVEKNAPNADGVIERIILKENYSKDYITIDGEILIGLEKIKEVFKLNRLAITGGNFPKVKIEGERKIFLTIPMLIYLYTGTRLDVYKKAYLKLIEGTLETLENAKTETGEELYFMENWEEIEEVAELMRKDCIESGVNLEEEKEEIEIEALIREQNSSAVRFIKKKDGLYIAGGSLVNITKKIMGNKYTKSIVHAKRFTAHKVEHEFIDIRGISRKIYIKLNDDLTIDKSNAEKFLRAISKSGKIDIDCFIEEIKQENKKYF